MEEDYLPQAYNLFQDVFGVGTETSSSTVEWAMSELLKNLRVMEKAQVEVRQVCNMKGNFNETDLHELKYLKMVIKETLRVHPPYTFVASKGMWRKIPIDYNGTYFEYIPFGAGRRICPGISFGLASVELALAQLLFHFDWKFANGTKNEDVDMAEALGVSSRRKRDLSLIAIAHRPLPSE
ncbi:hypothetical protein Vadar_022748 [Vaccinium darrowii]|uniref:Uncharacterized protein n=1 Tax=Vaccinium darrowii TaxID=229202 RepID=A0ACB7XT87_9ERIC|nr:hypothetical protein Vadar_022748 [Vaccinium darrowii]